MERTIRIQNKTTIRGFVHDNQNNTIAKGNFTVLKDKGGKFTLKHQETSKVMTIKKERFDFASGPHTEQSRRIPSQNGKGSENQSDGLSDEEIKSRTEAIKQEKEKEVETEKKKEDQLKRGKTITSASTVLPNEMLDIYNDNKEIVNLINAGLKNLWLVGPAGCGKSTIVDEVATSLKKPFYPMSCGLGTSAAEFQGYKYPKRESTPFADYFRKPSIILLDEFTALDANVAQVVNSALANDFISTTTGIVHRHKDCVIIATSNTHGTGSDMQYVSNNVLDASTLDRFVGGILNITYNSVYESKFDRDVREYVGNLRECIGTNYMKKIASTRMMIQAQKLKNSNILDWRVRLVSSWTKDEVSILDEFITNLKEEKINRAKAHLRKMNNARNKF